MSLNISEMRTVAGALQRRILSGMDPADAWNDLSVDLVRCAKVKVSGSLCCIYKQETSLSKWLLPPRKMYGYQNYWEEEGWCEVGGVNCSESP